MAHLHGADQVLEVVQRLHSRSQITSLDHS
jgi:hypothetical protein